MTFLAPTLLVLGLTIAVPLVLHLLHRHQGPRVVFPALRYLRRAEREHATRIRLRQVLLLALRILALLLLAAAAARPFLPLAGPGHHPTSVVIVLDNAMSSGAVVGDRRVLDQLRDTAVRTLEAAGPDDRFWLIRAGQPWEPAATGDLAVVLDAVRRTDVAGGGSDVTAEVERAASILAAEPAGRALEIHLLGDLRASSFRPTSPRPGTPPILVLAATAAAANRAITDVEVGGGMDPRSGERSTVAVTVREFGRTGEAADSVDVRLVLEGTVRAVARSRPGGATVLPFPAHPAGLVTGHVEVDPDALAADARRHFVAGVRPPPTVATAERLPYLDQALSVLEDARRLRLTAPGAAEVFIAPGAAGADAVQRGVAVIVLPPATPVELAAANQRLAAAGLPYRLGAPVPGSARLDATGTGLEGVLEDVLVREVYALEATGVRTGTVLIRLADGEPWAVVGTTEAGARYLILASPLTPAAGTIPTSAAMLPLLDRAINAWAVGLAERSAYHPGAVVTLPDADSIVRPAGGVDPVAVGRVYRLTEPGIYRLFQGDAVVAAYAVNPPPEASDVAPIAPAALAAMLPGEDVRRVPEQDWEAAIFHRRLGREVALPLLLATLLVLLVESALAAGGRPPRRRAGAEGAAGSATPVGAP